MYTPDVERMVLEYIKAMRMNSNDEVDLPLFGFDANSVRPRKSLECALDMMTDLTTSLQDGEIEDAKLTTSCIMTMLKVRSAEVEAKLVNIRSVIESEKTPLCDQEDEKITAISGLRASIEALLSSELAALKSALSRQLEIRVTAESS